MSYTITIPGIARGKQRPRATRHGRVYTPAQTVNAEAWIKQCAVDQGVFEPLEGPLAVHIVAQKSVPASWPKKKRDAALNGVVRACGKPDADNIAKLVCDSLNKIAWQDDSQIVELVVRKCFAPSDFTTVMVENI